MSFNSIASLLNDEIIKLPILEFLFLGINSTISKELDHSVNMTLLSAPMSTESWFAEIFLSRNLLSCVTCND